MRVINGEKTYSAKEIAKELNISEEELTRISKKHGIYGNPLFCVKDNISSDFIDGYKFCMQNIKDTLKAIDCIQEEHPENEDYTMFENVCHTVIYHLEKDLRELSDG
jgi:hypothetical protein